MSGQVGHHLWFTILTGKLIGYLLPWIAWSKLLLLPVLTLGNNLTTGLLLLLLALFPVPLLPVLAMLCTR